MLALDLASPNAPCECGVSKLAWALGKAAVRSGRVLCHAASQAENVMKMFMAFLAGERVSHDSHLSRALNKRRREPPRMARLSRKTCSVRGVPGVCACPRSGQCASRMIRTEKATPRIPLSVLRVSKQDVRHGQVLRLKLPSS